MNKIALISCTKTKQDYRCEAREMYHKSTLFKKITKFVENSNYDDWFIISAKYGLLRKNEVIEPYDITLYNMNVEQRRKWATCVFESILLLNPTNIDIFAGERYRQYLLPYLEKHSITFNVPLKGMQIGEQLSYLSDYKGDKNE
jgi:hypothetical protein